MMPPARLTVTVAVAASPSACDAATVYLPDGALLER